MFALSESHISLLYVPQSSTTGDQAFFVQAVQLAQEKEVTNVCMSSLRAQGYPTAALW